MNIFEILLLPLFAVVLLMLPVVYILKKKKSNSAAKKAFIVNLCSFFAVLALAVIFPVGGFVNAEVVEAVSDSIGNAGIGYLAAALSVGLGSIGCGIAVGSAAPAAIGAVAEEPKSFSKALIFVALGEGVALYGFLISFMILNAL
ncbi:ATP synthase subunit C [Porcipelethomonas sp.]|uniref:ATP synthase subunit C n=1 Tax=Porcipelethomonas sp. TaxID=2981675 RepID=UPI003EF316F3